MISVLMKPVSRGGRLPEERRNDIGQQPAQHHARPRPSCGPQPRMPRSAAASTKPKTLWPTMAEKKVKTTVTQSESRKPLAGEQADVVVEADPLPVDGLGAGQLEIGEAEGDGPAGEVEQRADQDERAGSIASSIGHARRCAEPGAGLAAMRPRYGAWPERGRGHGRMRTAVTASARGASRRRRFRQVVALLDVTTLSSPNSSTRAAWYSLTTSSTDLPSRISAVICCTRAETLG